MYSVCTKNDHYVKFLNDKLLFCLRNVTDYLEIYYSYGLSNCQCKTGMIVKETGATKFDSLRKYT